MEGTKFISIKQAEELTGIPEATLKRYMLKHDLFINFKKVHNHYQLKISALKKLELIRKWYSEGFKREAIDEMLSNEGLSMTITTNENTKKLKDLQGHFQKQENRNIMKENQDTTPTNYLTSGRSFNQ